MGSVPRALRLGPHARRSPAASEAERAIAAAFATWSNVEAAAVSFAAAPAPSPLPQVAPDAVNLVTFAPSWPHDPGLLALTSAWATDDGAIVAFDVHLNPDKPWATDGRPDAYDLQAAITHEVGHLLGIAHSDVPSAAMYATAEPGDTWRRDLDPDDIAAVEALYPDLDPIPRTPPRSGCQIPPTDQAGPSTWLRSIFTQPIFSQRVPSSFPRPFLRSASRRRSRAEGPSVVAAP